MKMVKVQEEKNGKGIWRYSQYLVPVEKKYQLTLGEGNTPVVEIDGIFFKREDLSPTGSIKDRGLAYQVSQAFSNGKKELVISSSGNAAISAVAYCRLAGIKLHIFLSPEVNKEKLSVLQKSESKIYFSQQAVSKAIKFSHQNNLLSLRSSVDKLGFEGYRTVAFEIYKELGKIDDLFLPVSSATGLVGIAEGFKKIGFLPRIHACQSTKIYTIAGEFDKDFTKTSISLASALVAKVTPRKKTALEIIKESGGWGWVIGDEGIKEATNWLKGNMIETSAEGALTLAAVWKARKKGWRFGKTVCLLTGRRY